MFEDEGEDEDQALQQTTHTVSVPKIKIHSDDEYDSDDPMGRFRSASSSASHLIPRIDVDDNEEGSREVREGISETKVDLEEDVFPEDDYFEDPLHPPDPSGFGAVARTPMIQDITALRGDHAGMVLHPDDLKVLYKGRKYNWQAKVNLHVHIIDHTYADVIEIIGFNTSTFLEAEHIFVCASTIYQRIDDPANQDRAEMIAMEYNKLHVAPPPIEIIYDGLKFYKAAMFLLDRLTVSLKPCFIIDVKDSEKSFRKTAVALNSTNTSTTNTASSSSGTAHSNPSKSATNNSTNNNNNTSEGVSLTQRKPDHVHMSTIRRYGKSATLVGEVVNIQVSKEEEILQKIISNFNSPTMSNQAQRIINRISLLHKQKKKNQPMGGLKGFLKFRNDNDLLQESLSFIHISDFFLLQFVCKRWHNVLSYALKSLSSLWITSRDYYLHEEFHRRKLRSRYGMVSRPNTTPRSAEMASRGSSREATSEDFFYHNQSRIFRPRNYFIQSETVIRVMKNAARVITDLQLHYVILNNDLIGALATLNGKLKRLTLGIIKVDETKKVVELSPVEPTAPKGAMTPRRPGKPGQSISTPRSAMQKKNIIGGSVSPRASTHDAKNTSPIHPTPTIVEVVSIHAMRYLNSADVDTILHACGSELTHLELSLTIGDLDPAVFQHTPKLQTLTVFNSTLAPRIQSVHYDLEGNVNLQAFASALQGIPMPDLLCYINDNSKEAFLLTDKRGRIVTANEGFEKMFGYSRREIHGRSLDFLSGIMTDLDEYEVILEGLKTQIRSEEVTLFLHDHEDRPFLAQVIMCPNISKYRGLALTAECLNQDFIGQIALEQEEAIASGTQGTGISSKDFKSQSKTKNDWRISNKELSYHLLRFGLVCEPFLPYERQHIQFRSNNKSITPSMLGNSFRANSGFASSGKQFSAGNMGSGLYSR